MRPGQQVVATIAVTLAMTVAPMCGVATAILADVNAKDDPGAGSLSFLWIRDMQVTSCPMPSSIQ
jgi:hypothetical protein